MFAALCGRSDTTNHAALRYRCVVEALNGIDEILDLGNGFINTDFARYLDRSLIQPQKAPSKEP
jgi:hypothetical protein